MNTSSPEEGVFCVVNVDFCGLSFIMQCNITPMFECMI
jgi:hypothetical protein